MTGAWKSLGQVGAGVDTGVDGGEPAPRGSEARGRHLGLLGWGAAVICGLVLAWLVVVRSLPVALAERWPGVALALNSGSPQALLAKTEGLRQAYYKLALASQNGVQSDTGAGGGTQPAAPTEQANSARDPQAIEQRRAGIRRQMRAMLRRAIREDPLNAVAFRMLGEIETDTARARAYMDAALARSKREPVAVFWLLNDALVRQDRTSALELAEILFRTSPSLRRYAIASFSQLASDRAAAAKIAARLRTNPWWRRLFFNMLSELTSDPRSSLNVMLALKAAGGRPTGEEMSRYLRVLLQRKQFGLAYYAWLNLLPAEKMAKMGLLNNGGFDDASDGEPFNWHFSLYENATVGLLPTPGGEADNKALHVSLGIGRVRFPEVRQYMKLPAGRYVVSGRFQGRIKSGRGLVWEALCVAKDARMSTLGTTDPISGLARQWLGFSFSFAFSENEACELVLLRLRHPARTQSERFIEGEIWFDDLKLTTVPG